MNFTQLKKELDDGKVRNIYVFTGNEKEVLNKYVRRICGKLPLRTQSFASIVPYLTSKGLFANTFYIVDNDNAVTEMSLVDIKKLVGKRTVIFIFDSIDKRKTFFKACSDITIEFTKFADTQLCGYIGSKIEIDQGCALLLSHYCYNEVSRIDNEIHKLQYCGKPITEDLIKELVCPPLDDQIFTFTEYTVKKEKEKAYRIYLDLIELKESPIKMISILYTTFKNLFLISDHLNDTTGNIVQKTGIPPFLVDKTRQLLGTSGLNSTQLLLAMKELQKTEVNMKTGKVEINLGMENLLLFLLKD